MRGIFVGFLLACAAMACADDPAPAPVADDLGGDVGSDVSPTPDVAMPDGSEDVALDPDTHTPLDVDTDTQDATPDVAADLPWDTTPDAEDTGRDGGGEDGGDVVCDDPELPPFGEISGLCGVLRAEVLDAPSPHFFRNDIDFAQDPYDEEDFCRLRPGSREVITDENAGGSSLLSEAMAFEMLARCEEATLLKTETEVVYTDPMGKLTDMLVDVGGRRIGVSVTRAVGFPREDPYPVDRAQDLLERKLQGVLDSTANVAPEDAWSKQVLYIIAYGPMHADSMETAWGQVDSALRADTVVIVTVTDGDDEWIY